VRFLPLILCSIGVVAVLFSRWGIKTDQGRHTFDEMAGIIPLAAGALGVLLIVVGAIWMIVRGRLL